MRYFIFENLFILFITSYMSSTAKTEKKGLLHNDYGGLKKQKTRKMFFSSSDQFSRMERYEELDKNHPLNRKFQGDAQFRGPICNFPQIDLTQREEKAHRLVLPNRLFCHHCRILWVWSHR
jgi:hypothetical protein